MKNNNTSGDVLFVNAKVYTGERSFTEAVYVSEGRIASAGSNEEVKKAASVIIGRTEADWIDDVKVIDCGGRTIVPGFSDSHMHLFGLALNLTQAQISDSSSVGDMVARCRDFAENNPERVKKGIYAAGWNQDLFIGEKRMPGLDDMNEISTDIPVCLERTCGHIVCCNSRLLDMMEERGLPLTEEQRMTGIFTEGDVKAPREIITGYTAEELADMVEVAMKRCASFGLTSVASNDAEFVFTDHALVEDALALLYDQGRAPVRYSQQISYSTFRDFEHAVSEGVYKRFGAGGEEGEGSAKVINTAFRVTENEWYSDGPLKLFTDGSLGARTAHLRAGYADDPGNTGLSTLSSEDLERHCLAAKEAGIQVVAHGIGDGAVEKIVDVYEKVFGPENPLRCGIIHCQVTDKDLLKRIASLNVPTLVQPIFLDYDIMIAEDRCGHELASTSYAFKTLGETGHMSFGTDCPVEDCDPFAGIYCAVARKRKDGSPDGGWFPGECMDVYGAVDAYTKESAWIQFAEDRRGSIKEGFDADLVVLDRDIFTVRTDDIRDIRPVLTMTGGEIVFEKE